MSQSPPACSAEVEAWLKDKGVSFKPCRQIPLDQIKRRESRSNQARAEALVPDVVERYVAGVKAGEVFPPIVVYRSGTGYVVIDGNHRDEAHVKAGKTEITAYEVAPDTPSDLIELLTVEANTRHGQPTDNAWRTKQAIHLMAAGHTQAEVLAATGIGKTTLERGQRVARSDARATRLGVYGWDTVGPSVKNLLAPTTSDPVFVAVADLAVDTGLGVDDAKALMSQVRGAPSEAEALRIIGEAHDQRKQNKAMTKKSRRSAIANPRMKVLAALGQVTSLDPSSLPRLFHTDEERKNVAGRCADAALVLMQMEEVLNDALGQ